MSTKTSDLNRTAGAWILNAHGHRYPMLARKFSGCIRSVTYVYDTEDC
jgi:hypothetical protein